MQRIGMVYNNKIYCIIPITDKQTLQSEWIKQTSLESLKTNLDGTKCIITIDDNIEISTIEFLKKQTFYTHQEILEIINTPEWLMNNEYDV